jgi:hypothetical protein
MILLKQSLHEALYAYPLNFEQDEHIIFSQPKKK